MLHQDATRDACRAFVCKAPTPLWETCLQESIQSLSPTLESPDGHLAEAIVAGDC